MGGKSNPALGDEEQALRNQTNLNNTLLTGYNNALNQNSQFYQKPLASDAQAQQGIASSAATALPGLYGTILDANGNFVNQTGINANQLGQNFTNYASNTGGTNLAQQNPLLSGFFQNEMQNGLNPQVAQNAQSQVSQQAAQQMADARAHAAPGQNLNAVNRDIQNNALAQSANLAGSLAGQSQNFMNTGAQGLGNTASGLDQQILNMLQQGAQYGQVVNTQALQNLLAAAGLGNTGLGSVGQFINQGNVGVGNYTSALTGMSEQAGNQAQQFGQQAAQQQQANSPGAFLGTIGGLLGGPIGGGIGGLLGGGLSGGSKGSFESLNSSKIL